MAQAETRVCQNCKQPFTIEPEDFAFYEKIQVPPPTFCPECRLQRRLAWYNVFSLYKRPCDLCGKDAISVYAPEVPYRVYCPACWWSDKWDPLEYGRACDFKRNFFEQFDELLHAAPLLGLSIDLRTAETSPYNSDTGYLKNCYLTFSSNFNEDCAYGYMLLHSRWLVDCSLASTNEFCYDSMHLYKDNGCAGVDHTNESMDCFFTRDCINCRNCFGSANLRNKEYYFFNEPLLKEEYLNRLKKINLGSYAAYQEMKAKARAHWAKYPPRPRWDDFSVNVTGNYVFESRNCKECFEVSGAEDSKFLLNTYDGPIKDCYDVTNWGDNMILVYDSACVGSQVHSLRFCHETGMGVVDAAYSKCSVGASHHFGCVAVKKKNYCIFNKEYSEEEFYKLRQRIIEHMDAMPYRAKDGTAYRFGEFFPAEMSPFAYNTTLASQFFPLEKGAVEERGWKWREPDRREYEVTMRAGDLPDHIDEATEEIMNEVIACSECGKGFRIIRMEYDFLKSKRLPLPRRCPFCRINERFLEEVKDLRVFKRTCSRCGSTFESAFPGEEVATLLCKTCYNAEVA